MNSTHDVVIVCPFIAISPDRLHTLVQVVDEMLVEHAAAKRVPLCLLR